MTGCARACRIKDFGSKLMHHGNTGPAGTTTTTTTSSHHTGVPGQMGQGQMGQTTMGGPGHMGQQTTTHHSSTGVPGQMGQTTMGGPGQMGQTTSAHHSSTTQGGPVSITAACLLPETCSVSSTYALAMHTFECCCGRLMISVLEHDMRVCKDYAMLLRIDYVIVDNGMR